MLDLERIDIARVAREGRKHAKDCCTATNVEDNFVLEEVSILVYRVSVGTSAHIVLLLASESPSVLLAQRSTRKVCRKSGGRHTNISS